MAQKRLDPPLALALSNLLLYTTYACPPRATVKYSVVLATFGFYGIGDGD